MYVCHTTVVPSLLRTSRIDFALVGGFLPLGFLDQFEQLVHRLRRVAQGAEGLLDLGELSMLLMNKPLFLSEMRRGGKNLPREHVEHTWRQIHWDMKRMVLRWYRATDPPNFAGWDTRMEALTARVPTQVIWGDRDVYISRSFAERFGGTVHRFPNAGHWVQVEEPDRVAELLGAFLDRVSGAR